MITDHGDPITDTELLDRIVKIGAVVVRRGPVERLDFTTWRRQLRAAARDRGFRLSVRNLGDVIVVSNPDHVVTDEQKRAAIEAIAALPVPPELQQTVRRRGLRVVRGGR